MVIMVCVKQLNVVGGTVSNLTIGKQYSVSPIPVTVPEGDEMKEPTNPKVLVWGDDINSEYQYPMEAFVTLDQWRELQLNKLI
jgi:hypothetical protein